MKTATHTGAIAIPYRSDRPPLVLRGALRETKLYYVNVRSGTRFRKTTGNATNKSATLILSTVEPIK